MSAMASQITSLTSVYSTVYSGADQRKLQSSASLAFVWGIHRWLVNSPQKGPLTRKMFPFDDVIMILFEKENLCGPRDASNSHIWYWIYILHYCYLAIDPVIFAHNCEILFEAILRAKHPPYHMVAFHQPDLIIWRYIAIISGRFSGVCATRRNESKADINTR